MFVIQKLSQNLHYQFNFSGTCHKISRGTSSFSALNLQIPFIFVKYKNEKISQV